MMRTRNNRKRATVLLMVVGLLAMLFIIVSAYITLARFDRLTLLQAQRQDQLEDIFDGVHSLVLSKIAQSWYGQDAQVLATGGDAPLLGYADSAGSGSTSWLSATEPVPDPAAPNLATDPLAYLSAVRYPGTTRFGSNPNTLGRELTLADALPAYDELDTGFVSPIYRIAENQRVIMLDADGDGIPDTYLPGQAEIIELAGAETGNTVSVPPSLAFGNGPDNTITAEQLRNRTIFRRMDEAARFVPVIRVIGHGGMVSFDFRNRRAGSLNANEAWNYRFSQQMFDWLALGDVTRAGNSVFNSVSDQLSDSAYAIEPYLRRRGGLPTYRPLAFSDGRVPEPLRAFERGYSNVMVPQLRIQGTTPRAAWQRFALYDPNSANPFSSWQAWTQSSFLDPQTFNAFGTQVLNTYNRRRHVTTLNTSDDRARVLYPLDIDKEDERLRTSSGILGLFPGERKFYLGKIREAFAADGSFLAWNGGQPGRGQQIVREIANYYYDMLSGYGNWGSQGLTRRRQALMLAVNTVAFAAPRITTSADPRDTDGFIDNVFIDDFLSGALPVSESNRVVVDRVPTNTRYVGYSPQLFITQVLNYRERDRSPEDPGGGPLGGDGNPPGPGPGNGPNPGAVPASIDRDSFVIELYNPNDPAWADIPAQGGLFGDGGNDTEDSHAIPLLQYAISINDSFPAQATDLNIAPTESGVVPTGLHVLGRDETNAVLSGSNLNRSNLVSPGSTPKRKLGGRSFYTVALDTSNPVIGSSLTYMRSTFATGVAGQFRSEVGQLSNVAPRATNGQDFFRIRLWRWGNGSGWVQVDEFETRAPDMTQALADDPDDPSDDEVTGYSIAHRDTGPPSASQSYFGTNPNTPQLMARWGCVTAFEFDDRSAAGTGAFYTYADDPNGAPPASVFFSQGNALVGGLGGPGPFTPAQAGGAVGGGPVGGGPPIGGGGDPTGGSGGNPTGGGAGGALFVQPSVPLYVMSAGARDFNLDVDYDPQYRTTSARPASFPTVGFLHFVPRFSHTMPAPGAPGGFVPSPQLFTFEATVDSPNSNTVPIATAQMTLRSMPEWLRRRFIEGRNGATPYGAAWPIDFGHMPLFDNLQVAASNDNASFGTGIEQFADTGDGRIPWGLLVYDYFTTVDPDDFVDPDRIPGRINVNTAPWYILAGLPVIGPQGVGAFAGIPFLGTASPAFYSRVSGVMMGPSPTGQQRFLFSNENRLSQQTLSEPGGFGRVSSGQDQATPFSGRWRLGTALGRSIAEYRDRIVYSNNDSAFSMTDAHLRRVSDRFGVGGGAGYGSLRDEAGKYGFISLGELLNVRGFAAEPRTGTFASALSSTTGRRDFMKAVQTIAYLDTHYLTTRSNVFTVYTAVTDRQDPDRSIRSQLTIDRTNLLPQVGIDPNTGNGLYVSQSGALPDVLSERRIGYYNARFDE